MKYPFKKKAWVLLAAIGLGLFPPVFPTPIPGDGRGGGATPAAAGAEREAARPVLKVGVLPRRPPLAFRTAEGEPRGLGVDTARLLGAALRANVELIEGRTEELYAMLERGDIDFASCVPLLPDAPPSLQLIPTGLSLNRRILVASPDIHITSEEDYAGRVLTIVASDREYRRVAEAAGARVLPAADMLQALDMLGSGRVEAYVARMGEVASHLVQRERRPDIALMGSSLERTALYVVVQRRRSGLASRLAGALTDLERDGALVRLREQWLGRPLTEPSFRERYGKTLGLALLGVLGLLLAFAAWTTLLRRKVAAVTSDLRDSERRYRELTEASPDLVMLLADDGAVRYANSSARRLLGAAPSSASGLNERLAASLSAEDRAVLRTMIRSALDGHINQNELSLRAPGGQVSRFEVMVFPTASGHPPAACSLWRDITARRALESELARADRLSVIGRMAAGVAHEINNPLGVIMANAEYLRAKGRGSPQTDAILASGERAAATTRRLLHLAVSPADRSDRLWEEVDLVEIVQENLAFLKPRLRRVAVETDLPASLPVRGERALLEQVVLNLLINALDSLGDQGSLFLNGRVDRREHIGQLSVGDDGPGMARADLERVFDLFWSTKGGRGFGLGLFVTRTIVERHGGVLYAESTPHRRTCFILELPTGTPDFGARAPLP